MSSTTDDDDDKKKKAILQSTPIPPWHSLAIVFGLLTVSVLCLPTVDVMDTVATIELVTHRIFPQYISVLTLAIIRAIIALIIWLTSIYTIFLGPGMKFTIPYLPGSKLYRQSFHVNGFKTMTPFTSWSWTFLGMYFTLASYVCFINAYDSTAQVSKLVLRITVILWEISSPFTLLVSSIVTYVIWPRQYAETKDTYELRKVNTLLMHNFNVVVAVFDATILGGIPVQIRDFPVAPVVGCIYVLFTWSMAMQWVDAKYGPQYIYFFMDPTLPQYQSSIAIIGLILVCSIMYVLNVLITQLLSLINGSGIIIHFIFTIILTYPFIKIRD